MGDPGKEPHHLARLEWPGNAQHQPDAKHHDLHAVIAQMRTQFAKRELRKAAGHEPILSFANSVLDVAQSLVLNKSTTGYAWVLSMAALAASGLFIHSIRMVGPFSPIHLLSHLTLWQLWLGVREARAGKIPAHRYRMQAIYVLALVLAGAFTLSPGQLMSRILFPETPVAGFVVILARTGLCCAWWLHAASRWARLTDSV